MTANSILFKQPVESILGQPLLEKVERLSECGSNTNAPAVKNCIDDRMGPLAERLLKRTEDVRLVSTFVMLKDGSTHDPRKICRRNFEAYIESAKVKADKSEYLEMAQLLKDAVLFARMGGVGKETIRREILKVVHIEPSQKVEEEQQSQVAEPEEQEKPPKPDTKKVPPLEKKVIRDQKPKEKGFFQKAKDYGVVLSGGPLASYGGNQSRTYLGGGGYGEILIPVKARSPYVFGAELQLQAKFDYDDLNIIDGELKTIRGESFPVLEAGYRGEKTSFLLQAGAWFAHYRLFDAAQERDPHSDNMLENLYLRAGVKTYLINNFLRLAGGFQRTPWGNGVYLDLGANFDLWGGDDS